MTNREKLEFVLKNYSYFFTVKDTNYFIFRVVPMEIDFGGYTEIILGNSHYIDFSLYDILNLANKNIHARQVVDLVTGKDDWLHRDTTPERVTVISENNFSKLLETRRIIIDSPVGRNIYMYRTKNDLTKIYESFKQLEGLMRDNYICMKGIDNNGIHFEINKEEKIKI